MKRTIETMSRDDFNAALANLGGDIQKALRAELALWIGGRTCDTIDVSVNWRGNLDSESSPRPAAGTFTLLDHDQ